LDPHTWILTEQHDVLLFILITLIVLFLLNVVLFVLTVLSR